MGRIGYLFLLCIFLLHIPVASASGDLTKKRDFLVPAGTVGMIWGESFQGVAAGVDVVYRHLFTKHIGLMSKIDFQSVFEVNDSMMRWIFGAPLW